MAVVFPDAKYVPSGGSDGRGLSHVALAALAGTGTVTGIVIAIGR